MTEALQVGRYKLELVENSANNNFATVDRLAGLAPGTSYTARLLVKQSGVSSGFDARSEILVESF